MTNHISHLQQEIALGIKAKELLENDSFRDILSLLEENYTTLWKEADDEDGAISTRAWIKIRIIREIKDKVSSLVDTGKMAAIQISRAKGD